MSSGIFLEEQVSKVLIFKVRFLAVKYLEEKEEISRKPANSENAFGGRRSFLQDFARKLLVGGSEKREPLSLRSLIGDAPPCGTVNTLPGTIYVRLWVGM